MTFTPRREPGFPAVPHAVLLPTRLPFPPELGFGSRSGLTLQPLGTTGLAKPAKMEQPCPRRERHPPKASEGRQGDDPAKPFPEPREGSEVQDWLMRLGTICWARCLQATGLGASDTNLIAPALPSAFCGLLPSAFCGLLPSSFVALVLLPQKATWTLPPYHHQPESCRLPDKITLPVALTPTFNSNPDGWKFGR